MRDPILWLRAARGAALLFGALVVWQVMGLISEPATLADPAELDAAVAPSAAPPAPPPFPEAFRAIDRKGIFGASPAAAEQPLELLGLMGEYALLRTPSGETGRARVGESVGGVKVIRVGTNRVLVEHDGTTKELSIYSGLGSDPLESPAKEQP